MAVIGWPRAPAVVVCMLSLAAAVAAAGAAAAAKLACQKASEQAGRL